MTVGRQMLDSDALAPVLEAALRDSDGGNNIFTFTDASSNQFKCYLDHENKLLIILTSVRAPAYLSLIQELENAAECKQSLCVEHERSCEAAGVDPSMLAPEFNRADYHILAGIQGNSYIEKHIVTSYCAPHGNLQIFDSKIGDVGLFFRNGKPGLGERIRGIFAGLRRAFNPDYSTTQEIEFNGGTMDVKYHGLGTQSIFDGMTCGYFTTGYILAAKERIVKGETVDAAYLRSLEEVQLTMMQAVAGRFNTAFRYFIQKAWRDTYVPVEDVVDNQSKEFIHYFLGWPREENLSSRVLYFLFLSFIFRPLISLLRLPTEFLTRVLAETAEFISHALYNWTPTSPGWQLFRSALLLISFSAEALLKAVALTVRTITAPIQSVKHALAFGEELSSEYPSLRFVGPLLAGLSVMMTFAFYSLLAVFAAPALVSALSSLTGVGAGSIIGKALADLALPLTSLFGNMSVVIAAAVTLIAGSAVIAGIKGVLEIVPSFLRKKLDAEAFSNIKTGETSTPSNPSLAKLSKKDSREYCSDDSLSYAAHHNSLFSSGGIDSDWEKVEKTPHSLSFSFSSDDE